MSATELAEETGVDLTMLCKVSHSRALPPGLIV